MFSSVAHSTTRRKAATPALCPARRGRWRFVAQRPLPSIIMAKWRTGTCDSEAERGSATGCDCVFPFPCDEKRPCNLVKLDLQNLQFLGFPDFIHLIDEAVGELL